MESDEELMTRVALGDEAALGLLVERYTEPLQRFLQRWTRNRVDAEDLLQDTWVRIARGAKTFRPNQRFRSWAYRIALNLARDAHRRRTVREAYVANHETAPTRTSEDTIDLRRQVDALPESLRDVLLLRYYAGMTESEMTEVLAIPNGTVKSRLHTAIRRLREGSDHE